MKEDDAKIIIAKNGPYIISGKIPLAKEESIVKNGCPDYWKTTKKFPQKENYSLCRCGKSSNKPFCDGTHIKIKFNGKETADFKKFLEKATTTQGPTIQLKDCSEFCSSARFCHKDKGTWDLTEDSGNSKSKKLAIETACNCPSGRLVIFENNKPIEPNFKKSISVLEDPQANCSGPLWIKGKIPIVSSSGKQYEIRNRVTLCRCGKSSNKPFCDSTHISIGFSDKN